MFKATLFIDDKEYALQKLYYNLRQETDYNGRPNSKVFGGKIYFTCAATSDDSIFLDAAISQTQTIKGEIVVYKRDGFAKAFDLKFANTFVTLLNHRFNSNNNENLMMDLELSALIMEIRGSIYESLANPNNPFVKNDVPLTVRTQKNPTIKRSFYAVNNKEITELEEGKTQLIIESVDMIGEYVTIDLSDNQLDFIYENEVLEGDLLEDIEIRSNRMVIELNVIKEKTR